MNILNATLSLLLLTGPMLLADPTPISDTPPENPAPAVAAPAQAVDPMAEALPILQKEYPGFAQLNFKSGDQLPDLVARSNGGIQLLDQPGKPHPIFTALLPDNIGYWRVTSFTPGKTWDDLAAQLGQWNTPDFQGLVLDLRSTPDMDALSDYSGATQVAAFFAHDATNPFSMSGSNNAVPDISFHPAHPYLGTVVVLIDHKTGNAAEALAGYLKLQGALLIGQSTAGTGNVFGEKALSSGQVLRYEETTVALHDGTQLAGHPVMPDIEMTINDHNEKSALILIRNDQVLDVIGESPQRHLMSEAALIQGIDPEWDSYLAGLEKKPFLLSLPIIHDDVLISALDSLKAIHASQKRPDPIIQASAQPSTATTVQ